MIYADKYVSQVGDIPREPHFAILRTNAVSIPEDERSRTNPGHGYPARTDYYLTYEAYLTREKWKAAIAELESGTCLKLYNAIEVHPAVVTRTVKVSVAPIPAPAKEPLQ